MKYLALVLLLAGCQQQDSYSWKGKQIDQSVVTITKVEVETAAQLQALAKKEDVKFSPGEEGFGFGKVYRNGTCTVYFVNPDNSHDPVAGGHEAMHCFYGNWHN